LAREENSNNSDINSEGEVGVTSDKGEDQQEEHPT
jgi:hypothetical protein